MSSIETWGLSLILWLQSFHGPAMDLFFRVITLLGDEKFYLLLLPLVYWCIDKRLGLRLALVVLASNTVNLWLKFALGLPRPPVPPVRAIATESDPGFPSGHTQAVTVAFGYLVSQIQRWRAHILAAILVFLVAVSRLYLGVHYPHDVVGGLIVGYLILFLFVKGSPPAEQRWRVWPRAVRYGLALGLPLLALALWPLEDTANSLGALAGFGMGGLFEGEQVRFRTGGPVARRLLRFLFGLIGVAVLYFGLKIVLPEGILWHFVRYAAVGLYGAALAPWLFVRSRLAEADTVSRDRHRLRGPA